jgi:separase
VANLWDVSDRDIDRFATHLIKSFAESPGSASLPLSAYMASARESCKLKWIIGAAPVVIGIPSIRAKSESEGK